MSYSSPVTPSGTAPNIETFPEQAAYHFISGYTAKVAGTEVGVTEPMATFSSLFRGSVYASSPKRICKSPKQRLQIIMRRAGLSTQVGSQEATEKAVESGLTGHGPC